MSSGTVEMITNLLAIVLTAVVTTAVPIIAKVLFDWIKRQTDDRALVILQELIQAAVEAAEGMFENGAEKKAYALQIVAEAAKALKLNLSDAALDKIVDMLLEASVYRTFNYNTLAIPPDLLE